jgi:hypothetical protein
MTPEQAIDILDQIAAKFHGNRQDHILINEAMGVVKSLHKQNEDFKREQTYDAVPKFTVKTSEMPIIKSVE